MGQVKWKYLPADFIEWGRATWFIFRARLHLYTGWTYVQCWKKKYVFRHLVRCTTVVSGSAGIFVQKITTYRIVITVAVVGVKIDDNAATMIGITKKEK